MKNIPKWIELILEEESFYCPICKEGFDRRGIVSVGIRVSLRNVKKEVLFILYLCSKCKKVIDLEFGEMTMEDFALNILDELNENEINEEKNKKPFREDYNFIVNNSLEESGKNKKIKSKITYKEIKDIKKALDSVKTHEEFLFLLGFTEEDINEYRFEEGK